MNSWTWVAEAVNKLGIYVQEELDPGKVKVTSNLSHAKKFNSEKQCIEFCSKYEHFFCSKKRL